MEHAQKIVVQSFESELPVQYKAKDENIQISSIFKDVFYHSTINMCSDIKKTKSSYFRQDY